MFERPGWLARILDRHGRTAGTGIAVDREHVITCGHLASFTEPDATPLPGRTVTVEFPFAGHETGADVVVHHYEPGGGADLAVLVLKRPLPQRPNPPWHRAHRFAGREVLLRGFPDRDESVSPTATAELSEFSRPGWVQINPVGPRGWTVRQGFSGGPVWDARIGAIVGMVVAKDGSDTGHMETVASLCELWPELAEFVRMPPVPGGEAAGHWWPRARGVQRDAEVGWRFRGRGKAIAEIAGVLDAGRTGAVAGSGGGPASGADMSTSDRGRPASGAGPVAGDRGRPASSDAPLAGGRDRPEAVVGLPGQPATAAGPMPSAAVSPQRRRPLIVTGSPGVGKSAVLARFVTTSHRPWAELLPADDIEPRAALGSVDCAVHAQGKSALEVAQAIALAAGVHDLDTITEFPTAMREALTGRGRFGVVIDAVDEALDGSQAEMILSDVIVPLAQIARARVVAGSRKHLGTRRLLSKRYGKYDLLDLDEPEYFELAALENYALATLRSEGEPGWVGPYDDREVAWPVAKRIAKLADGNFLVAGLVALTHGLHDEVAVAPESLRFEGQIEEVFREYLARLGDFEGVAAADLLTALAFAEPPGFTAELWSTAVSALDGVAVDPRRLEAFAKTNAASFLVEQVGDEGPVYRLFHQALVEEARRVRTDGDDEKSRVGEGRLARAFLETARHGGWEQAPAYLLRSLAGHAARGGAIDELLVDTEFLVRVEPQYLLPWITMAGDEQAKSSGAVFRNASKRLSRNGSFQRRMLLAYNARRLGADWLVDELLSGADEFPVGRWWPRWATGHGSNRNIHTTINCSPDAYFMACATVGDRAIFAIQDITMMDAEQYGDNELIRTVSLWDLNTGVIVHELEPLSMFGHDGRTPESWKRPQLIDIDGRAMAVTFAYSDDDVGLVNMDLWELPRDHDVESGLNDIASKHIIAFLNNGRTQFAISRDDHTDVRLWDLRTGRPCGPVVSVGRGAKCYPQTACFLDGRPVLATAGGGEARLWDLASGRPVVSPLEAGRLGHQSFDCGVVDGRLLAASFGHATVQVWDLVSRQPVGEPLRTRTPTVLVPIQAVSFGGTAETPLVTIEQAEWFEVWNVVAGCRIMPPIPNRTTMEIAHTWTTIEGRPITVISSDDDNIKVWSPEPSNVNAPTAVDDQGIHGEVTSLAVSGDDAVLSLDQRRFNFGLRSWDATSGAGAGAIAATAVRPVNVKVLNRRGSASAIVVDVDGGATEWCPASHRQVSSRQLRRRNSMDRVADFDVLLCDSGVVLAFASSRHISVALWNVPTSEVAGIFDNHPTTLIDIELTDDTAGNGRDRYEFGSVFCALVSRRLVAVTNIGHGVLRVYDVVSHQKLGDLTVSEEDADAVMVVVSAELRYRPSAIAGTCGGYVRAWDLDTLEPIGSLLSTDDESVRAVAYSTPNDSMTVFAGTDAGNLHVFDLETGDRTALIPFNDPITALATLPDGRLIVASGSDLACFEYRPHHTTQPH